MGGYPHEQKVKRAQSFKKSCDFKNCHIELKSKNASKITNKEKKTKEKTKEKKETERKQNGMKSNGN